MGQDDVRPGNVRIAKEPKARPDFAQLFEAMPGQYMILNRDLVYVEANPAYCASTERARDEIVGRYVFDAFPPTGEGGRQIEESLRRVLATGIAETLPLAAYPIPVPGGRFRMKYWSCAHLPLFDENGDVAFVAQNAVDVTELQNLKTIAFGPDPGAPVQGESELFRRALEVTAVNDSLAAEMRGLRDLFMQAPGFMAVLTGPELIYAQVNNAYLQLIGHRPVVGRSLAEALPEVVEQGFGDLLLSVMRDRTPHIGRATSVMLQRRPEGPLEERFVDFIFQPIAGSDGECVGVFIEGSDVTDRVLGERRRDALLELDARLRETEDADELAYRSAELLGAALGVSRAGYGDIDHDSGTITVRRAWSLPGLADVAGVHDFAHFGTYFDELRSGQAVRVYDVETDVRTAHQPESFRAFGIRAFLDAPVVEDRDVVAEVFVHSATARVWTDDDLSLAREFAERTRAAIARRKAEADLQQSEVRYRTLFETIDQGFCIVEFVDGPDGPLSDYVHIEANDAYERHAGISGVLGRTARQLLPPEEADGWVALLRKVLMDGEPVRFERELVASERYLEVACFRVEPAARRQLAILFQDVTARRQAEQRRLALVELSDVIARCDDADDLAYAASEILGRTLDVSRVGYATIDPDAETLHVPRDWTAPGVESLAGVLQLRDYGSFIDSLKRGEFICVPDVRQDDRTGHAATALECRSARAFVNVPVVERGRLSAVLYVNHDTARDWADEELALIREVAERTRATMQRLRAEDALRLSAESLRLAVEAAEIGTWDLDLLSDILTWSDRTKAAFGLSPDAPSTMEDFYNGLHPDDLQATTEAFASALDPARRANYDVEYRTIGREDGVIRWVAAKGVGIFDEDGRCIRALGTAIDVTGRKRVEQELRDLNETLELRVAERAAALGAAQEQLRQSQKMEAMGSLTGGVAHDFNNLLTPIVGTLDMLQRQGLGGEREQRLIAGAAQSAERAKTLVQRLLAFARRQPLQATGVDLGPLVKGMADLISSTTGPQIKVVVDAPGSLPPAVADPNQVEMAILNLAVNARDAMPDGGVLRISVQAETVGPRHRTKLSPGLYLLVSVADTGCGMDEATARRAVEPFFSTKGIGKGTGLGLSMVHGLASQLGGTLTIRSKRGLGTNVELWLPQSNEPLVPTGPVVNLPTTAKGQGTALLVDDEDIVRLTTADMLNELGYKVVEAGSAEEALKLIDRGLAPDLLITDHLMSGMSGTDLARTMVTRQPNTKVLIVSGYAEAEGIAPDLPRLTKPFRTSDLAASLRGLE